MNQAHIALWWPRGVSPLCEIQVVSGPPGNFQDNQATRDTGLFAWSGKN